MGKILQTTYKDTVEDITSFYNNLVSNPFYLFTDKRPTIVTYYNINKTYSSLDPGSKLQMDNIGEESPIRYNRIFDFLLYGFSRIETNSDNGEFGLEDDRIEGECYILPNTIIPTEGDYFEVSHIKDSTWLFQVKDAQKDTLDNGSNAYKISYKLEYLDNSQIQSRIIHNFRMIESREGTNMATIVRCEDYDIAKLMDDKSVMLKRYFQELFYNEKVQTFIYMDITEIRVYDPFMIEFMMRNDILNNGKDSFVYVNHKIPPRATFGIDYDRTIFRVFETNNKEKLLSCDKETNISEIKAYGSIFSSRYEDYFQASFIKGRGYNTSAINDDLLFRIEENNLVDIDDEDCNKDIIWQNIIIKYFNHEKYTEEEIKSLEDIHFDRAKDAFYYIPFLIFCLDKSIENTLK